MTSMLLDASHNPTRMSWVPTANAPGTAFPIQNLPFGRFRLAGDTQWRVGVAIGEMVLDLRGTGLIDSNDMAQLISLPPRERQAMRLQISEGLRAGSPLQTAWAPHVMAQSSVELGLPCDIRDYTDFYIGIHHATAVGKLFRPDNPLLPNYKWVPIGYHGRASTILASGQNFHRPWGQVKSPDGERPVLRPTDRLDLELELGIVVSRSNHAGRAIPIEQAEDHVFGLTLFNDWSARDFQAWEYQPLGPFLAKNFASTISPWMVTLDALAPFRRPFRRSASEPQPLPYLDSEANRRWGAFDIDLDVWLQTTEMRNAGLAAERISHSNFAAAAYWTVAQLVTHHSVNGCLLAPGDLMGTGTLSGPAPDQAGSLLELTEGGQHPLALSNGESRTFLQDGDSVTFKGYCSAEGHRTIGLGECTAQVLAAIH